MNSATLRIMNSEYESERLRGRRSMVRPLIVDEVIYGHTVRRNPIGVHSGERCHHGEHAYEEETPVFAVRRTSRDGRN